MVMKHRCASCDKKKSCRIKRVGARVELNFYCYCTTLSVR